MNRDAPGSDATLVLIVSVLIYGALWASGQLAPHTTGTNNTAQVIREVAHDNLRLNTVTGWVWTPDEPFTVQVISTAGASRDEVLAPVLNIYPQFHVVEIVRQEVVGPSFMLPDVP